MAAISALTKIALKTTQFYVSSSNLYAYNSVRHFKKILKRTPKLFLNEDEALKHGFNSPFKSPHWRHNAQHEEFKDELDPAKTVTLASNLPKEKILSKFVDVPEYEILKEDDKAFTKVMTLMKSRKMRDKKNKILLEGKRLIKDAIDAGVKIEAIYFSKEDSLTELGLRNLPKFNLRKVSFGQIKMWSDLSTSPGIIAECQKPEVGKLPLAKERIPVTLICDNIREPGNLGAILRCAAASGCQKVLATTGCVDVWDSKVLRGAAGSHFHIPIYNNIDWQSVKNYLPDSVSLILADNNSPEEFDDENQPSNNNFNQLPTHKYTNIEFSHDAHVALVIGGETEGVSKEAYKLASDNNGFKVTIPLANNVESLNAATSSAVILFEICRQLNETTNT